MKHQFTKKDIISFIIVVIIFSFIGMMITIINMQTMRPKPAIEKTVDEYVSELTVYYIKKFNRDVKVIDVSMRDIERVSLYKETGSAGIYKENDPRFTVFFQVQDDYKSVIEVIVYKGDRFIEIRK